MPGPPNMASTSTVSSREKPVQTACVERVNGKFLDAYLMEFIHHHHNRHQAAQESTSLTVV
jgi:hypothetical protein